MGGPGPAAAVAAAAAAPVLALAAPRRDDWSAITITAASGCSRESRSSTRTPPATGARGSSHRRLDRSLRARLRRRARSRRRRARPRLSGAANRTRLGRVAASGGGGARAAGGRHPLEQSHHRPLAAVAHGGSDGGGLSCGCQRQARDRSFGGKITLEGELGLYRPAHTIQRPHPSGECRGSSSTPRPEGQPPEGVLEPSERTTSLRRGRRRRTNTSSASAGPARSGSPDGTRRMSLPSERTV